MFERFTDRARRVLVLAQEEARLLGHDFIGTEHLMLGLLAENEGVAAKALTGLGVDLASVRQKVADVIARPPDAEITPAPPFTPFEKKVLELSLREALQLGHSYIGTEHLLLGLVREGEGVAAQVLVEAGLSLDTVRRTVIELLSGYAPVGSSRLFVRRSLAGSTPAGREVAANALGRIPSDSLEPLGSHHFLLALFDDPRSLGARVLESLGVTEAAVAERIKAMGVAGTTDEAPPPDEAPAAEPPPPPLPPSPHPDDPPGQPPTP